MNRIDIHVETVASGQPRAYADSRRVYRVWAESVYDYGKLNGSRPWSLSEDQAKKHAGVDTMKAYGDRNRMWCDTYLEYAKEVEPGVWEIKIVEPYLD